MRSGVMHWIPALLGGCVIGAIAMLAFGVATDRPSDAYRPSAAVKNGRVSTMAEARPQSHETEDRLKQQATELIPTVHAQQADRLKQFQADHEEEIKAFRFRCERYGDFLSLFITRKPGYVGEPAKIVMAVNLQADSPIQLVTGRDPDLGGSSRFRTAMRYGVAVPDIDGASLYTDMYSLSWSSNGRRDDPLSEVVVDNMARPAEDDQVVFGQGAEPHYNHPLLGSSYGSAVVAVGNVNGTALPGTTISIPTGLGEGVYKQILAALKEGADLPDSSVRRNRRNVASAIRPGSPPRLHRGLRGPCRPARRGVPRP